jgi:hypothetical protein
MSLIILSTEAKGAKGWVMSLGRTARNLRVIESTSKNLIYIDLMVIIIFISIG